jgi:hypothetical protein
VLVCPYAVRVGLIDAMSIPHSRTGARILAVGRRAIESGRVDVEAAAGPAQI